jgi:hypothetical protein
MTSKSGHAGLGLEREVDTQIVDSVADLTGEA